MRVHPRSPRILPRCSTAGRPLASRRPGAMFLHDFLRSWIRSNMQDPAERDRKSTEYLLKQREIAARMKRSWAQPTKPYGFWTTGEANAKHLINQDPGVQKLVGRKPAMDV